MYYAAEVYRVAFTPSETYLRLLTPLTIFKSFQVFSLFHNKGRLQ